VWTLKKIGSSEPLGDGARALSTGIRKIARTFGIEHS
jgi:hypothetical protein